MICFSDGFPTVLLLPAWSTLWCKSVSVSGTQWLPQIPDKKESLLFCSGSF